MVFFFRLYSRSFLRWVSHFDWSDFLKWNHIWIWNIEFGAEKKEKMSSLLSKEVEESENEAKNGLAASKCAVVFYGFGGHATWKIRFTIFWPWLLHERGVSQLFHLTTVLENANFSCFAKMVHMCGHNLATIKWWTTLFRRIFFFIFFWNPLFFNAYHECAWYVWLPFRKRLWKTQPNVFHAIGYSGRGHLTFILLGKISSSIGLEYLGILLRLCMFHLSLLDAFKRVTIVYSIKCAMFMFL